MCAAHKDQKAYGNFQRGVFYLAGLLILALGITLNTKSGLGVSPIISVAFCSAQITETNFGDMTFALYAVFILIELLLHLWMEYWASKDIKPHRLHGSLKKVLLLDILQLPLALIFSRFINLFSSLIPEFDTDCQGTVFAGVPWRIFILLAAIVCTGVGAAMSLDMRLVPNPGDGIVQTLSDLTGKSMGLVKNIFDAVNICITLVIGCVFAGAVIGIGVGTVAAVLGVGRVVALFNRFFLKLDFHI